MTITDRTIQADVSLAPAWGSASPPAEPERSPALDSRSGRFYRPELDALRFAAFFGVFLYHDLATALDLESYQRHGLPKSAAQWISATVASGKYGVDLFFVLSAYLITELLIREVLSTGKLEVRGFYARRILRIWPLYFMFLGLSTFVLPRFFPYSHGLPLSYLLCFLLLTGNWICAIRGYARTSADALWSVSLEEQFYLIWPLIVRLVGIGRLAAVAIAMFFVAAASRVVLMIAHASPIAGWCNTFSHLDSIACGILLAVWLKGKRPNLSWIVGGTLGIAALLAPVFVERFAPVDGGPHPPSVFIGYPVVALSCGALVFVSLSMRLDRLPRRIGASLIYLGRISYGLYVYHIFSISVADHMRLGGLGAGAAALAITVLLAAVSYRWLEQPFLRYKMRFTHVLSRPGG